MKDKTDLIEIRVNIDIEPATLHRIVENAKKLSGLTEKGYYQVDTAAVVSKLISRFLLEEDFNAYAENLDHYEL
jgi:hypothetical protein